MKHKYVNRFTGQESLFENSNSFILFPSIIAWLMGEIWGKIDSNHTQVEIPKKNIIFVSSLILLSALAMMKAIYVTNFPLVILFKSCNILSVITVGVFCSRVLQKSQKLGKKKMITGLIITFGVLLYHFGGDQKQQTRENSLLGILLLMFSLVLDGFVPDFQAQIKTKYSPDTIQLFSDINKWKAILALAYSIASQQLPGVLKFFFQSPLSILHILILSVSGSIGQIVVYWMINNFKQHVVPFVTTSRKIFTVVLSIAFFQHKTYWIQNIGIIIVFSTVLFDFMKEVSVKKGEKGQTNDQTKIEDSPLNMSQQVIESSMNQSKISNEQQLSEEKIIEK